MPKKAKIHGRSLRGGIPILTRGFLREVEKEIKDHERGIGKTYPLEEVLKEFEKPPARRRHV